MNSLPVAVSVASRVPVAIAQDEALDVPVAIAVPVGADSAAQQAARPIMGRPRADTQANLNDRDVEEGKSVGKKMPSPHNPNFDEGDEDLKKTPSHNPNYTVDAAAAGSSSSSPFDQGVSHAGTKVKRINQIAGEQLEIIDGYISEKDESQEINIQRVKNEEKLKDEKKFTDLEKLLATIGKSSNSNSKDIKALTDWLSNNVDFIQTIRNELDGNKLIDKVHERKDNTYAFSVYSPFAKMFLKDDGVLGVMNKPDVRKALYNHGIIGKKILQTIPGLSEHDGSQYKDLGFKTDPQFYHPLS